MVAVGLGRLRCQEAAQLSILMVASSNVSKQGQVVGKPAPVGVGTYHVLVDCIGSTGGVSVANQAWSDAQFTQSAQGGDWRIAVEFHEGGMMRTSRDIAVFLLPFA